MSASTPSSEPWALDLLRESEALLTGHFELTSGLHSDRYFQCALLFQYPERTERVCRALAERWRGKTVDLVIGPAVGGIIIAYELARQLKARTLYTERQDGVMRFRRGFALRVGEKVLVAEDVVTSGGSVQEVITRVNEAGGQVVGVASVVNRNEGNPFACDYTYLLQMIPKNYERSACPMCRQGLAIDKPGSRGLR